MKNKVLLVGINAKYIHSNPAVFILKAYAEKYYGNFPEGCSLDVAEYTINQSATSIMADIYRRMPDVVAFSCYIWNWGLISDIVGELGKVMPHVHIWLGGPEVTYDADLIVTKYPEISGVMVGEGEETFCELLHYYYEDKPRLCDIRGLVTRDGFTGMRPPLDINEIPFMYGDLEGFQNRIIYYESQRGCPFKCAYCLSSIDKKLRFRDIDKVRKELKFFIDNNVPQVKFIDRTFNCNHTHAMAIWQFIKENDNGITNFHFEIAADLISDEEIKLMGDMRAGLIQLEIGVQSTNQKTLMAINRHMDLKKLEYVVNSIHGFGNIHQHLDLIAGLPYEDYESFGHSFDDVYKMAPDQLQLGFLKVLKGSPMEETAKEFGIAYSSKPPYEVLSTNWLSYADVLNLKEIEQMVELYYNSGQFVYTLGVLVREFASPFKMFEKLAVYYREGGYFTNTPARSYRYEVLYGFACGVSKRKDSAELYRELLTFDMYLRENLKSRPSFMGDNKIEKGHLNGLPKNLSHVEKFNYPVWDMGEVAKCKRLEAAEYVLFDYSHRNPLTHNAKVSTYYEDGKVNGK